MAVAQLTVQFHLSGCRSLKDKRRRLAKLRDKFGRQSGMAVAESGLADSLNGAQWMFVACASDARVVDQMLAEVRTYVTTSVDAEVTDVQRNWLA